MVVVPLLLLLFLTQKQEKYRVNLELVFTLIFYSDSFHFFSLDLFFRLGEHTDDVWWDEERQRVYVSSREVRSERELRRRKKEREKKGERKGVNQRENFII